jgi:hypothetical protein
MTLRYTVREGDCLSSIAHALGFIPDTIWNDDSNAGLREERSSPYVLLPGDVVSIPDKRIKAVPAKTGAIHRFRRLSVPAKLRLQLVDVERKPRGNLDYTVTVDGREEKGTTDAEGALWVWIPNDALQAFLTLASGEVYTLRLGHLAPVTTDAGVRARLHNLGYLGDRTADAEQLAGAVRMFQEAKALEVSGVVDDALRDALLSAHGS